MQSQALIFLCFGQYTATLAVQHAEAHVFSDMLPEDLGYCH